MRHFVNAASGYNDKSRERWEQARMIAWYSAFDRKPMRITEIPIPGERSDARNGLSIQQNKEDAYRLLEKWNK